MKKNKGILSLILTTVFLIVLGITCVFGIGQNQTGAIKNINLGLDLAGGVSITYEVTNTDPTSEQMADTIYKLQKRVEQYSTEATGLQAQSQSTGVSMAARVPHCPGA